MSRIRQLAATIAATATLTSCVLVGGDSTAQQIATLSDQQIDMTEPGCGWTTCIPLADIPDNIVILFVSVNDRNATNLTGYSTATSHYRNQGADVIWVAVPELDAPFYGVTAAAMADLNLRVAAQLGCQLAPATLRHGDMVDGIHYSTDGALTVTLGLQDVTEPLCV